MSQGEAISSMVIDKELNKQYMAYGVLSRKIDSSHNAARSFEECSEAQEQAEAAYRRIKELESRRAGLLEGMMKDFDLLEDGRLYQVLVLRYVECLPWNEIAMRMKYAESHVKRLRNTALKEIATAKYDTK